MRSGPAQRTTRTPLLLVVFAPGGCGPVGRTSRAAFAGEALLPARGSVLLGSVVHWRRQTPGGVPSQVVLPHCSLYQIRLVPTASCVTSCGGAGNRSCRTTTVGFE